MQRFETLRNGVPVGGDGTSGGLRDHRGRNLRNYGARGGHS